MAPKLGEILICAKIIDQHQLDSALSAQQKWGGKLGEILVNKGLCSEEMMVKALSRQLDIVRAELDRIASVPQEVLEKIPLELSQRLDALPLELRDNGTLLVTAMSDPLNTQSLEILREQTGCRIHALLAGPHAIARSRNRLYQLGDDTEFKGLGQGSVRGRAVVRGAGEQVGNKLFNRENLAISMQPAAGKSASPLREEGNAIPADFIPADATGPEILRALIGTLIEKNVFTRDEFLKHLKKS